MNPEDRVRPIQSVYWLGHKKKLKTTFAVHASNAVPNAQRHLQWNDYAADRVEVFNCITGKLYAVITAKLNGTNKPSIESVFEVEGMRAIKREKPKE